MARSDDETRCHNCGAVESSNEEMHDLDGEDCPPNGLRYQLAALRSRLSEVEGERDTLATQLAALRSEIGRVLVDTCTLAGDTVWRSETQTLGEALAHLALPDVEHPLAVLFDEPGYAPDGWLDAFRSRTTQEGGE